MISTSDEVTNIVIHSNSWIILYIIVSSGISLPLSYKPRIIQGEPNQHLAFNAPAMLFMKKDRPLWDRSYLNYIYDIFIELELDGNIISVFFLKRSK